MDSVCRQLTGLGVGHWGRMFKRHSKESPLLLLVLTRLRGQSLYQKGELWRALQ